MNHLEILRRRFFALLGCGVAGGAMPADDKHEARVAPDQAKELLRLPWQQWEHDGTAYTAYWERGCAIVVFKLGEATINARIRGTPRATSGHGWVRLEELLWCVPDDLWFLDSVTVLFQHRPCSFVASQESEIPEPIAGYFQLRWPTFVEKCRELWELNNARESKAAEEMAQRRAAAIALFDSEGSHQSPAALSI